MVARDKATTDRVTTLEDVNLVAYLVMHGITAIPYVKTHGEGEPRRVAWDIDSSQAPQAAEIINQFYENRPACIKDFVRALKEVRADMYSIKLIRTERTESPKSTKNTKEENRR